MNIDDLKTETLAGIQPSFSAEKEAELYKTVLERANGNVELVARAAIKELSKQVLIEKALTEILQHYEDRLSIIETSLGNPRKPSRGRPKKLITINKGVGMPIRVSVTESIRMKRQENESLGVTKGRKPTLGWIFKRETHAMVAISRGVGGNAKELAMRELEHIGVKPGTENYNKMLVGLQKAISDLRRNGFP